MEANYQSLINQLLQKNINEITISKFKESGVIVFHKTKFVGYILFHKESKEFIFLCNDAEFMNTHKGFGVINILIEEDFYFEDMIFYCAKDPFNKDDNSHVGIAYKTTRSLFKKYATKKDYNFGTKYILALKHFIVFSERNNEQMEFDFSGGE